MCVWGQLELPSTDKDQATTWLAACLSALERIDLHEADACLVLESAVEESPTAVSDSPSPASSQDFGTTAKSLPFDEKVAQRTCARVRWAVCVSVCAAPATPHPPSRDFKIQSAWLSKP